MMSEQFYNPENTLNLRKLVVNAELAVQLHNYKQHSMLIRKTHNV